MFQDEMHFATDASQLMWFSDPAHYLLGLDASVLPGATAGRPYEQLSIIILPGASETRLISIVEMLARNLPGFAGELVFPGSAREVVEREPCAAEMTRWGVKNRIFIDESDESAYRNSAMHQSSRAWLLLLDARISFEWNPLPIVEKEIQLTCAPAVNLARVTRSGGFVSVDHIGFERTGNTSLLISRSLVRKTLDELRTPGPAICSGIDSASLLIKRELLKECGGFDPSDSVYESDVKLAAKLFRRGIKVIVSDALAIYDDELASPGFHRLPIHVATDPESANSRTEGGKPRVGLVIDVDHWAFGNISRQLQRYLSDRYEFVVVPSGDIGSLIRVLMLLKSCKLIHFFWREEAIHIESEATKAAVHALGMSWDVFYDEFIKGKFITTSIYDHLFHSTSEMSTRAEAYRKLSGYTVANDKLFRFYSNPPVPFPTPICTTEDGVDLTLFTPRELERFEQLDKRELVVGWVGNSAWEAKMEDFKGLHSIIRPAIDELRQEGYPIKLELADRQQGFIPHDKMPAYYQKIDVLVCASKIEGTPNPVLEAMACGVPVVSTDVGIVPQALGSLQREFILSERSVVALKEALKRLVGNAELLRVLSAENLDRVTEWDWSKKAQRFRLLFDTLLEK